MSFAGCQSASDVRAVLRREVDGEVAAMLDLIGDADAFDVIELMRLREFSLAGAPDLHPDGSGLNVEIVAALLLGRGARKPPGGVAREETRPHEVIEELHSRASRLMRLATLRLQVEAGLAGGPLAKLSADYQGAVVSIRNLQYDVVRDAFESELFDNPVVAPLMAEHLGYTYGDVIAVRRAMREVAGDRMTALRDETAEMLLAHRDVAPADVPADVARAFMDRMVEFMFLPGQRAAFSVEDVAAASGVAVETVAAVLGSYSQPFDDSASSADRVWEVLTRTSPFLTTPLVADGAGAFAETTNGVGLDSLRRVFEAALPGNSAAVRQYDQKVRMVMSERVALDALERLLCSPAALSGFGYFQPKPEGDSRLLRRDCPSPKAVGIPTEGDGLFVVGDVAVCVEVKGKSMSAAARRGDSARLMSDLKKTIGEGCAQAVRLQTLIEENGGIWLTDGHWFDLSKVREVRSIVALIDDVGPLGTSLHILQHAGIVPLERTPLVVSLHDLEVMAQVCDRASEFLLYLRRRTDSDVSRYYHAVDELDLFSLFLRADLYVAPDPYEHAATYPTAGKVSSRDRKDRKDTAVRTMVGDECAELNRWMEREFLENVLPYEPEPPKPSYNAPERILDLIDTIDAHAGTALVRFGADVLALSGEAQEAVLSLIDRCIGATRDDGLPHDGMMSFAGVWGHPTLFVTAAPQGMPLPKAAEKLQAYMRVKRHQLRSDRAYGLVYDSSGGLGAAIYFNDPVQDDPEMDELVRKLGLKPVGAAGTVPPSARRSTRRLRGKRRR